jgi:hypothetical protein
MRWGATLLVALLVASAGCSSLPASGPTETLTPVPLPAESTTTPAPASLAPGIDRDGLSDVFLAADAHRQAFSNRSFVVVDRLVVRGDARTLRRDRRELRVAPGGLPYRYTVTSESGSAYPVRAVAPRIEVWYDGTETLFRVSNRANVSYQHVPAPESSSPVADVTNHHRLLVLYDAATFAVSETGNGTVRLSAVEGPDPAVLHPPTLLSEPRDPSLTILVRPGGRVTQYRLQYVATFEGRPVLVDRHVSFRTEELAPLRPGWFAEARNATR